MPTFFETYLERLLIVHQDIANAIEGLPPEALDWSPGPEINSINVLVTHALGAERYWIGDVALGELSGRDRAAEFRVKGRDATALRQLLTNESAYVSNIAEKLMLAGLERVCISPRDGREFTVAWALVHALEHTALHCGHIQLTRQWWDLQHPKQASASE